VVANDNRNALWVLPMGIGKAMVVMICFMIAVVAMITMFSIASHDKATDEIYNNATNTINATTGLAQSITTSGTGFMQAMILIVAILFFFAVIMIFRKK
jgi:hypothetical protein